MRDDGIDCYFVCGGDFVGEGEFCAPRPAEVACPASELKFGIVKGDRDQDDELVRGEGDCFGGAAGGGEGEGGEAVGLAGVVGDVLDVDPDCGA